MCRGLSKCFQYSTQSILRMSTTHFTEKFIRPKKDKSIFQMSQKKFMRDEEQKVVFMLSNTRALSLKMLTFLKKLPSLYISFSSSHFFSYFLLLLLPFTPNFFSTMMTSMSAATFIPMSLLLQYLSQSSFK